MVQEARLYPLLDKAGIRRIRIHDARHTYATLLLQAGEPIAYVKEQLGHSSIQVTVDLYGHFVPGANRAAVERLAEATAATEAPQNFDVTSTEGEALECDQARLRRKSAI